MAGSIGLSLTQRLDNASLEPLDGGTVTFYAAGTTTPQSAYQDVSLTIPWPNPLTLDAGNIPQLFFADGYIKFRISNSAGVTQLAADNVLVIGPSAGAGAAPSVDASTVLGTGDLKARYGTGVHTGWVRSNGRTIGSASSGASERANSDCQDLFEYLWGADANLAVSTGRGVSANADWSANKTIALPDWRGRALAFLDDMGNSAANRLGNGDGFGAGSTTLGSAAGAEVVTLTAGQIPTLTGIAGTNSISVQSTNYLLGNTTTNSGSAPGGGTQLTAADSGSGAVIIKQTSTGSNAITVSYVNGSQTVVNNVPPMMLATIYIKL